MRKLITLLLSVLLIAGLFTGCNGDAVEEVFDGVFVSEDKARSIAAEEIDGVFAEDIKDCQLIEDSSSGKIYRATYIFEDFTDDEGTYDGVYYEIDISAKDGTVLQIEIETLKAHNGDYSEDVGKEAIKEKVFEILPGTSEADIVRCTYKNPEYTLGCDVCFGRIAEGTCEKCGRVYSADDVTKPHYEVEVINNGKYIYMEFDAKTGEEIPSERYESSDEDTTGRAINEADYPVTDFSSVSRAVVNSGKRPVWITGHRCNTNYKYVRKGPVKEMLGEKERKVRIALDGGCNAIEIDIGHRSCDDTLRVDHDGTASIFKSESVEDFLSLPEMKDPRLCLVIFDIKEPQYISRLIDIVHKYQKEGGRTEHNGSKYKRPKIYDFHDNPFMPSGTWSDDTRPSSAIYFVYSVPKLGDGEKYFTQEVANKLWVNEGLCVDMSNKVDAVNAIYNKLKFERGWFGDGLWNGGGRGTRKACQKAVQIRDRAGTYDIKAVESWTAWSVGGANEKLKWGIDSVMLQYPSDARGVLNTNGAITLANRRNYPFKQGTTMFVPNGMVRNGKVFDGKDYTK